jgi:DNA-binding NtrC family response regulator/tetratricopeptide (TPR) repeat protein
MNQNPNADQLANVGRFSDALKALKSPAADADALFRAELLERTGSYQQSRAMALAVLRSKKATPADRSICESILGLVDWQDGNFGSSIVRLQRSASLASDAGQLERSCWSRLRLLVLLCDQSGPDAFVTLLPQLRADILRTGAAHLLAAFHIFIGQSEAKRGLLRSGMRHSRAGIELLSRDPNLWLEATSENTQTAIFIMLSNFDAALKHGQRGLFLAEESGVMNAITASLGNLGNLFFQLGDFTQAADYLHKAIALAARGSEHSIAVHETLAQIYLADGRLDSAAAMLQQIELHVPAESERARYVFRHTQLTKSKLLLRQNRRSGAMSVADEVSALAQQSGDVLLSSSAELVKAELLIQDGRVSDALSLLESVVPELPQRPPRLYGVYESLIGLASVQTHSGQSSDQHFRRAEAVFDALGNGPDSHDLRRRRESAKESEQSQGSSAQNDNSSSLASRDVVQAIAMMLLHAHKPQLVAAQMLDLLGRLDCCEFARSHQSTNELRQHAEPSAISKSTAGPLNEMLTLATQDVRVQFEIRPKSDIESRATVNAIALLVSTIQELEQARTEREERLTLWPIEDVPLMNEHAVVNGKMRELITTARRVATTNISVLLTGESGTGKEILARAIHTFSDRAEHAFVPFNCAALPRDMLESQLFGHRRGAFTGADRDNPGVIRAARGGTLFLDEIGELNVDLQPKLLRFLESGEICPLGETTPFTVNVRIIAATNAKLEQAVKSGRFREDLFYRLNVVRLQIPPLRERRDELPSLVHHFVTKAALEYRKGQIRIAENTMERLLLAPWPGNIRQLQNELRRMIALADAHEILTPGSLSADVAGVDEETATPSAGTFIPPANAKLNPTLARIEREMIRLALHDHQGKMDAAAKSLGISRKGLYLKRQRLGL